MVHRSSETLVGIENEKSYSTAPFTKKKRFRAMAGILTQLQKGTKNGFWQLEIGR